MKCVVVIYPLCFYIISIKCCFILNFILYLCFLCTKGKKINKTKMEKYV